MRKIGFVVVLFLTGCLLGSGESIQNVSPEKAFEMVKQPDTHLIDVRSVAEYIFVGHPNMAYNIPLMFWNEAKGNMESNREFIQDLQARFQKSDRLIFICRSGGRSARAAGMAREFGFAEVFNVETGFEGDKNAEGYRNVNGWKNSGLPYTYALDRELSYINKRKES